MEAAFFIIILFGIVGIIKVSYAMMMRLRISKLLSIAAQKYGLKFNKSVMTAFPFVSGSIKSFSVLIEKYVFSFGKSRVQTLKFVIDIKMRNLNHFNISAEGFMSHLKKMVNQNDMQIGDKEFDHLALIQAKDKTQLCILLNRNARSIISYLISTAYRKNFRITRNKIIYYIPFIDIHRVEDIGNILDNMISLAKIFCRKGKPADLIKNNYMMETNNEVKKQLLMEYHSLEGRLSPDNPLIKMALKDYDAEIQFLGATLLKKDGYNHLKKIYINGNSDIKKSIIAHLKDEKIKCFFTFLMKNMTEETEITAKKDIADYLGMTGDIKAESLLRKELGIQRDHESQSNFLTYKQSIIRALRYCGTYESIESLYHIKEFSLKREAEKAIAMIQDRIGAGDKGWLSLTSGENEDGKLTILNEKEVND